MLKKRIIPCLDVKNGRVVKGIKFLNLKDSGDPIEQAKIYDDQGADEICFLDITASFENRDILLDVVQKTATSCSIPLTVGGGIKSTDDIKKLLLAGADKISINTAAVLDHNLIKQSALKFGSQCIVIAIDAKKTNDQEWKVFTHGGRINSGIDVQTYAKIAQDLGAGEILLTSMDRDGTKLGYDLELIKKITQKLSIPVIASGGVGTLDHFYEGFSVGEVSAVLAASVFHNNELTIGKVKNYLDARGIPVRLF